MRWVAAALVWLALTLPLLSGESAGPGVPGAPDNSLSPDPVSLDGATLFRIACAGCHRIEAGGPHDVGPNLHGIVGQPAATRAGYAYSEALGSAQLSWDRGTLAAWIAATEILVPASLMSYANILDGDEVARLLDYLLPAASADASGQARAGAE